tara:strand:+ start:477 stop:632 length:156 start_codon:yes stop_codon:yes gene_type:complete
LLIPDGSVEFIAIERIVSGQSVDQVFGTGAIKRFAGSAALEVSHDDLLGVE